MTIDTTLQNATILDFDPLRIRQADIHIRAGRIASITDPTYVRGSAPASERDEHGTVVPFRYDCTGKVVIPGLVVGHHHLYSALAVGMPPPKKTPRNFVEILEQVWWKLDQALDDEAVYMSALVGAAEAARCGVTSIIDHHASPRAIAGSLDRIRDAMALVGMRGVLCYEVTDRHGPDGAKAGLEENTRFLRSAAQASQGAAASRTFGGLVGAHASFTLNDDTMAQLADLADQFGTGVHIHVAEDPADVEDCRRRTGGKGLIARLAQYRLLRPGTLIAHGTHLTPDEIAQAREAGCTFAHQPRSNMNNSVGYAPIAAMAKGELLLGTDGIDGDLFAESKTAWFKARDAHADLSFGAPLSWMANSARFAGRCLGEPSLGKIEADAPADLVVLDYPRNTPLTSANALGHWFFGAGARMVESVYAQGRPVILHGKFTDEKIEQELSRAPQIAQRVWNAFEKL